MNKKLGQDQLRNNDQLQNNNDRPPLRPGPNGRNGQPSQQRPSNNLNKWLVLIVGIVLIVYIYNYFNLTLTSNAPSQVELSYTDFYKQVEQKNSRLGQLYWLRCYYRATEDTYQRTDPVSMSTSSHILISSSQGCLPIVELLSL